MTLTGCGANPFGGTADAGVGEERLLQTRTTIGWLTVTALAVCGCGNTTLPLEDPNVTPEAAAKKAARKAAKAAKKKAAANP